MKKSIIIKIIGITFTILGLICANISDTEEKKEIIEETINKKLLQKGE